MKIKDYLTLIDKIDYRNARLYGSAVMVEYGGRQAGLANLIAERAPRDDANRQNLLDVMTAIGSGSYFHSRRTNKRARWIRKLILRKLDLAK